MSLVGIDNAASTLTSHKDSFRRCGCAINKALRSFRAFEHSTVVVPRDIQKRVLRASEHASPAKSGRAACYWEGLPKFSDVSVAPCNMAGKPARRKCGSRATRPRFSCYFERCNSYREISGSPFFVFLKVLKIVRFQIMNTSWFGHFGKLA
jgi:hypothetical protein